MAKKAGEILVDLWNRVDQAPYDTMIEEAFHSLPTKTQKEFIERLLRNNVWDRGFEPNEKELKQYRRFVGMSD